MLEPSGPAIGFSTDLAFDVEELEFLPGDILISFTDGITEAKNMAGDFYTDERLSRKVAEVWPSALSALKHLEVDVNKHIGGQTQSDDITLLGLRRCQPGEVVCHSFRHKAELANLPLFRNFILEASRAMKLDSKITEALQLAIDEVCSNLIIHGYKDLETGEICLSVRKLTNEIEVMVEDKGHPFDPASLEAPDLSDDLDRRKIGGLGIYLVREMVDDLSYESRDGGNTLSLKMRYKDEINN